MSDKINGIDLIQDERQRQILVEGFTPEHDEEHDPGDLSSAGECYLTAAGPDAPLLLHLWPWAPEWWKPKDIQRNWVRAGALFLAAADRAQRFNMPETARLYRDRAGATGALIDTWMAEHECTEIWQARAAEAELISEALAELLQRAAQALPRPVIDLNGRLYTGPHPLDEEIGAMLAEWPFGEEPAVQPDQIGPPLDATV
jgi:hypothetical protein